MGEFAAWLLVQFACFVRAIIDGLDELRKRLDDWRAEVQERRLNRRK